MYPSLYLPFARHHYAGTGIEVVGPDTELVIEGFGRSGSSFAVDAFEAAQRRPVRIAHHTHAAAQVVVAARMGIPTLVIVRNPCDATTSHMARRSISAKPALRSWIGYHERILPHRDRILIVPFEAVTSDFGDVVRALNARFGTRFDVFDHTAEREREVFDTIEQRNRDRFAADAAAAAISLARPSAEREAAKRAFRAQYEAEALGPLRDRADRVYQALVPHLPG